MRQLVWIGLAGLVLGAVWAYAQTTEPPPAQPPVPSPPGPTAPAAPGPAQPTPGPSRPVTPPQATDPDPRLYGPEIWRLPPVTAPAAVPPALVMPPVETIPTPPPVGPAPVANVPLALPGVSLCDAVGALEVKPSAESSDKLWDGSFDLGLDGSEGNSETYNFRFGLHAKRKTENTVLTLGLDYNKQTAQTVATADRAFFEGRYEWLFTDSRWSCFAHETVEYNEFQAYDVLDTTDLGLGYRLIKNEATTLIGRFGGGFSHEYGGPESGRYVPEAVFGLNLERKINKRQKFLGSMEYAPNVTEYTRYRVRTQAAWEVLLDEDMNLSMRMGVLERYNSMPTTARQNDLDYALTLLWKF